MKHSTVCLRAYEIWSEHAGASSGNEPVSWGSSWAGTFPFLRFTFLPKHNSGMHLHIFCPCIFLFFSDRGRIFRPVRDLCWIIAMRVYSPLQNIAFHSNSFLSARLLEPSLLRRETERTAGVWGAVQGLLEWGGFCPLFATFKKKAWFRHVQ